VRELTDGVAETVPSGSAALDFPIALAVEADGALLCLSHRSGQIAKIADNETMIVYDALKAGQAGLNALDFPRMLYVYGGNRYVDDGMNYFGVLQNNGDLKKLIGTTLMEQGVRAQFISAYKMVVNDSSDVFVTDMGAQRIYKISSSAVPTVVAGDGTAAKVNSSNQPMNVGIGMVAGIAIGNRGEILFSSIGSYTAVRSLNAADGLINIVGTGKVDYLIPPIGAALEVNLPNIFDLVQLGDGSVIFSAAQHNYLLRLGPTGEVEHLIPPMSLRFPSHLIEDIDGAVVFVEKNGGRISKINNGVLTSIIEDSDMDEFFPMSEVNAITVNKRGEFYVASRDKIVVITPGKKVRLIAGVGSNLLNEGTRDGGLHEVRDIDISPAGDLYILEPRQLKKVAAAQLNAL
jgi:hypothetical protein